MQIFSLILIMACCIKPSVSTRADDFCASLSFLSSFKPEIYFFFLNDVFIFYMYIFCMVVRLVSMRACFRRSVNQRPILLFFSKFQTVINSSKHLKTYIMFREYFIQWKYQFSTIIFPQIKTKSQDTETVIVYYCFFRFSFIIKECSDKKIKTFTICTHKTKSVPKSTFEFDDWDFWSTSCLQLVKKKKKKHNIMIKLHWITKTKGQLVSFFRAHSNITIVCVFFFHISTKNSFLRQFILLRKYPVGGKRIL